MGVYSKSYLVLGANVGYNYDFNDEKYLPFIEGHSNVEMQIIPSCYDYSYAIAGKVLKESDDNGFGIIDISSVGFGDILSKEYIEVKKFLDEYFGEEFQPKLLLFTHWY